jgi:hypothetical protein
VLQHAESCGRQSALTAGQLRCLQQELANGSGASPLGMLCQSTRKTMHGVQVADLLARWPGGYRATATSGRSAP